MNQPAWLPLIRQAEQVFDQGQLDQAHDLARQVLAQSGDCVEALQIIGLIASRQDRLDEAIDILSRVLQRRPDFSPSHNDIGMCYYKMGDVERSLEHYEKALLLQPDHRFARFNRASACLKLGRYREGWLDYEWRWFTGGLTRPEIRVPRWDGSPLNGREILIHTEQGLGDVIQSIRFLPRLKQQGTRIHFACQTPLHPLLKQLDSVDEWFPIGEPGQIRFDVYSPLLSLPALLGVDSEQDIACDVPYLFAEEERVARWRPEIDAIPGMKIGLCWQGSPTFKSDQLRSVPLKQFLPLRTIEGISLVSLQKGFGSEQIALLKDQLPIRELAALDEDGAFLDTAAVMQSLDLVITSDSAIAHLAGALGRPVWLLVSTACDWRWLMDREDSPWYPTMRIFRQKTFGDWKSVMQSVVAALRAVQQGKPAIRQAHREEAIQVPIAPGELLDKISILEIKLARIADETKRANVAREWKLLESVRTQQIPPSSELTQLTAALKQVNEQLWEIEDSIRIRETEQDFGERFVELARSVYQRNDQRAALKREINELLGSTIMEEKSYAE